MAPASRLHVGFFWDASLFDYRGTLGNPYGGLLVEALQPHGVTFERLAYNRRRGAEPPAPWLSLAWVWRNRGRVNALHLHWLAGFVAARSARGAWRKFLRFAAALCLARLLGYRIIWTLHNMLPHERPHRGVDVAGRYLMAAVTHAIICHCGYARRAYARRFRRQRDLHVIPHGNFVAAYPNHVSRAEARRQLGIPPDAFVFVSFGNIRTYKGHDDLLAAFARLPGDHLRMVVAGARHASYAGALAAATPSDPRVIFSEGQVPIDQLQVYFNAGDVAVFPYRDALTSGALITALGFGKPVISTRVGCIPETVNDPLIGALVPPGDVAAFAAAMRGAAAGRRATRLGHDRPADPGGVRTYAHRTAAGIGALGRPLNRAT